MNGIWSLPVLLTGTSFNDNNALGRIIIDIIFFVANLYPWARLYQNNGFKGIKLGTNVLLIWYILTILDLFLHESRLKVRYGYILSDFVLLSARFATDILILTGTHRLTSAQLGARFRKAHIWLFIGTFFLLVLTILAFYTAGSFFGEQVLWLQVANPSVITSVAIKTDEFEAAFFIIQFLLSLAILAGSGISLWTWRRELPDEPIILKSALCLSLALTSTLFIRSFSELIIVIDYHLLHHATFKGTLLARDTLYGLLTFTILLIFSMLSSLDSYTGDAQASLLSQMEQESRHYILNEVEQRIAGERVAPPLRGVIQAMRTDPNAHLSAQVVEKLNGLSGGERARLRRLYEGFWGSLEASYGHLVPLERVREF